MAPALLNLRRPSSLRRVVALLAVLASCAPYVAHAQEFVRDADYHPTVRRHADIRVVPQPNGILAASGARFLGSDFAPTFFRISRDGAVLGAIEPPPGADAQWTALLLSDGRRILALFAAGDLETATYRDVFTYSASGTLLATVRFDTITPSAGIPPLRRSFKLVPLPDGRVAAGGDFSQAGGQNRAGLARILSDGTLDPAFAPTPASGWFRDLVVLRDGSVVIATGGTPVYHPTFDRSEATGPARLTRVLPDGSTDPDYAVVVEDPTFHLVQADGRIVIRGAPLARLLPSGGSDPTFAATVPGLARAIRLRSIDDTAILVEGADEDGMPCVLALDADGHVLLNLRDLFPEAGAIGLEGVDTNNEAWVRIGHAGALVETRDTGVQVSIEGPSLARVPLGSLTPGSPPTATRVVISPTPWDEGRVVRMLPDGAGRIIVSGEFDSIDGYARRRVARLSAGGEVDGSFAPADLGPTASACLVHDDGRVLVKETAASTRAFRRLRPDGADDTTLPHDSPLAQASGVDVLALDHSGNYLATESSATGGGGTSGRTLLRYSTDGRRLQTIATVPGTGPVAGVAELDDGHILVAAAFAGSPPTWPPTAPPLVRLAPDGSVDPGFRLGLPVGAEVTHLVLLPDGTSLATLFHPGALPNRNTTVRIRSDGTIDPGFRLSPQRDGAFLIAPIRRTPRHGYIATLVGAVPILLAADGAVEGPLGLDYPILSVVSDHLISPDGSTYYQAGAFWDVESQQIRALRRSRVAQAPAFSQQPESATAHTGADACLEVRFSHATEATYQWQRDGVDLAGATASRLFLDRIADEQAGVYRCIVTFGGSTLVSNTATLTVLPNTTRLINFSARSRVEPGHTQIGGIVVDDPAGQPALLRAIGSALPWDLGVPLLPDPLLTLHDRGTPVAQDRGGLWAPEIQALGDRLGAFRPRWPWPDNLGAIATNSALARTLAPGIHTAHTTAYDGQPGVSLFEYYDTEPAVTNRGVRNLSIRAVTGPGADVLIPGFVVRGTGNIRLLIRAIGPSLAGFGVSDAVADPRLIVRAFGTNGPDATNDDWAGDPAIVAAAEAVSAFALDPDSKDAALVVTLPAGAYTVQIPAAGDQRGEVLAEIYVLEP